MSPHYTLSHHHPLPKISCPSSSPYKLYYVSSDDIENEAKINQIELTPQLVPMMYGKNLPTSTRDSMNTRNCQSNATTTATGLKTTCPLPIKRHEQNMSLFSAKAFRELVSSIFFFFFLRETRS